MYLRTLQILFFVMLVPAIFVACGMKKAPDDGRKRRKASPEPALRYIKLHHWAARYISLQIVMPLSEHQSFLH